MAKPENLHLPSVVADGNRSGGTRGLRGPRPVLPLSSAEGCGGVVLQGVGARPGKQLAGPRTTRTTRTTPRQEGVAWLPWLRFASAQPTEGRGAGASRLSPAPPPLGGPSLASLAFWEATWPEGRSAGRDQREAREKVRRHFHSGWPSAAPPYPPTVNSGT